MLYTKIISISAIFAIAPGLVAAEPRFSADRSGGVDATGGNANGVADGYRSSTFDELANLTAPVVDFTPIENRITNLESTINNNITSMDDLSSRISSNTGSISTNLGRVSTNTLKANDSMNRANQAYALADAAYNKATAAAATAASANNPNIRVQSYTSTSGVCHVDVKRLIVNGRVVSSWSNITTCYGR